MSTGILPRLKHLFSRQGFRGPVLTLLSGSMVALGLSFILQPVLTRLYTPSDFGVADYFIAILSVLMTFASLRYEAAMMLPEDDRDAANILWLSFFLLCFVSLLCLLILPWRYEIARAAGIPNVAPWFVLIAPTLLLMRTAKLAEIWLTRSKRFGQVTAGQVTNSFVMNGSRIGIGITLPGAGPGGLIGGFTAGHLVTSLFFAVAIARQYGRLMVKAFDLRHMLHLANRYRRFSLYSTPSALLNALVARLPLLLIPLFFDEAVIGLYGRATNTVVVPMGLIGSAIAQVFFVHAAEAHRGGNLEQLTRMIHGRLVMIGMFPSLVLMIAGPDVFEIVFGEEWREAGIYIQYLAPWLFLAAVASPLTNLFDVLERQRTELLVSIGMFFALSIAVLAGGLSSSVPMTLLLIGSAGALVRLVHLAIILRLAQVARYQAILPYIKYGLIGLPFLLVIGVAAYSGNSWLTLLISIFTSGIYALIIVWRDRLLEMR